MDRIIEPVEKPEKRRLPSAGGPTQDRYQMRRDRDVDVMEYGASGPRLGDAAKLEGGDIHAQFSARGPPPQRTWPAPSTTNRCEVSSSRPIGPYACTREVLIPISAPMPS